MHIQGYFRNGKPSDADVRNGGTAGWFRGWITKVHETVNGATESFDVDYLTTAEGKYMNLCIP